MTKAPNGAETTLLLAVKPRFAELIMNGSKSVELRRVIPRLSKGDKIALYVSHPIGAVVGFATVDSVISGKPTYLWSKIGAWAGVTRSEFRSYFSGSERAHGIKLAGTSRFGNPVTLGSLRSKLPGFRPPQNFLYLQRPSAPRRDGKLLQLLVDQPTLSC